MSVPSLAVRVSILSGVGGLIILAIAFCWWGVMDMKRATVEKKATRELCYAAGYSEKKDGWCIKGIDAPVLVESLRGNHG